MLGKAKDIKTKTIYEFDRQIHCEINDFLATIPNADVLDIKFNTYTKTDEDEHSSTYNMALVIYKEGNADGN